MVIYGVSANEHDASLAVVDGGEILFAAHAERYSRRKNDPYLNAALLCDAVQHAEPELVVWYERPFLKRTRKLWAGQHAGVLTRDGAGYLHRFLRGVPVRYVGHHASHAAGGFFTSPFDDAAILVVDAIGEWETMSVWTGHDGVLKKIWSQRYPHSLGLLYSAFTQRVGFKPNEEEYILMGMAAYGRPVLARAIWRDFVRTFEPPRLVLRENVHRGIRWWRPDVTSREDIAASIQQVTEEILLRVAQWVAVRTRCRKLVLMGGVALNCVANTRIAGEGPFDDIWIMPNPGDAGSSLGAVAAYARRRLAWRHPYLGHDIGRTLDVDAALAALLAGEVVGVATGRAEFGPRALGNRSLLADPRGARTKDKVNRVKLREPFRPFAPIVMAEAAHEYFEMPQPSSPFMQFVAPVRHPSRYPAICHYDNTARVQTVTREQNAVIYGLLERFHRATGCAMLLNTSLNLKGEPLVNSSEDAERFAARSHVRVY